MPTRLKTESGVALVAVLLSLALVGALGAAVAAVGTVEFRTAINHRSATRALMLADAGATHALAALRGPLAEYSYSDLLVGADGMPGTDDDGILDGYGLDVYDALPVAGVEMTAGRYYVRIMNDDGDPSGDPVIDTNHRLVGFCRGVAADGGTAEIGVALIAPAFPALVSNGDLLVPGNPNVLGPCAGMHANGRMLVDGVPTVNGDVTASDTVVLTGVIRDEYGILVEPKSGWPEIDVPDHDPLEYCDEADYELHDGWIVRFGPPGASASEIRPREDSTYIGDGNVLGWSWDDDEDRYTLNGKKALPATYCVHGDAVLSGNLGSDGDPMEITTLATGSIEVTGTPKIEASHSEDVLLVAGGDVKISGHATGITPEYRGMIYGRAQCQVNGTPQVYGFILCYDADDPPGAYNLVDESIVNGDPTIFYDCTGERRKTMIASWWESRSL